MAGYEIVIHLRDSAEPTRIPMPGVPEDEAEADRRALIYDLEEARSAEVPIVAVRTRSGFPQEPVPLDPHRVTEVDLIELPAHDA